MTNTIKRFGAATATTLALALPAMAIADKPTTKPGKGPKTEQKAHGKLCQGESKKHVKGEKGTAFSRCVKAMHKAEQGASPKAACKGLSKKHVKGTKGTPYSRCIVAAAHAKGDDAGPTGPTGPTGATS